MSSQKINLNKKILALFSGQASTITTPRLYIQLTGSHSLGAVLNQAVYWSTRSHCDDQWFYKKYDEWFEEINVPERTLRRHFDKLEERGWITTKVKKVGGNNIKHVRPDMERIIESISTMLNLDRPNRPQCPDKPEVKQPAQDPNPNPCTIIAPTGQIGRLEPANLAGSSYTDDYLQINTTKLQVSSSFVFSESVDQKLLDLRHPKDTRSDEEFLKECLDHVENHSDNNFPRLKRAHALAKLLTRLRGDNIIFTTKTDTQPEQQSSVTPQGPFSSEELAIIADYKYAVKMQEWGASFEIHMPDPERRARAEELMKRLSEMEDKKECQPATSARRNCSTSVSNLVSHLA